MAAAPSAHSTKKSFEDSSRKWYLAKFGTPAAVVVGLGLLYLFLGRPDLRSDAPAGDAIPTASARVAAGTAPPTPPTKD